ncbi:MAG: glycosyltransferase family 2 protein [Chloroflexi bacterium]|nr:glycosyltransferase family 2 protein [Chloroflexota bacterium]
MMRFSIIILGWNGAAFLENCLRALLEQNQDAEIVVVDNASTDDSIAVVQKFLPRVQLIRNPANLGFAGGNNVGIRAATGDAIILLNQDTVVHPGWLRALAETFDDSTIGIVGCKSLYPDARGIQHAGGIVQPGTAQTRHSGWGEQDAGQYDTLTEPDYVTGAAFAIRRAVIERLGGLDENFYPVFYEEVDYCYRARRAGFRVVYQPRAVLHHSETTTFPASYHRAAAYQRNRIRFVLRHWDARALDDFFAREQHTIASANLIDDSVANARAYWDNLLAFPLIASQRRNDATLGAPLTRDENRRVLEMLAALRQAAHHRIATLIMHHAALAQQKVAAPEYAPVAQSILSETIDLAALYTHIENMEAQALLEWAHPHPRAPGLRGWMDTARDFLVTPLLRHYLEPLAQQQSAFNVRTFRALATLMRATDALSRLEQLERLDAARVSDALSAILEQSEVGRTRDA